MKKFLLSMCALALCGASAFAQGTLTVADNQATNSKVPINTLWYDAAGTISQVIYPAEMLESLQGTKITALKFYVSGNGTQISQGAYDVSMGITEQTQFETTTAITGLTVVKTGQVAPEKGTTELEIIFDDPFDYEGGNLVLETKVTTGGGYGTSYFYGENNSLYVSFSRSERFGFIPKTTFTYETETADYAVKVMPDALDFGRINIDTDKTMNITVKNRGNNAVTPVVEGLAAPFSTTYTATEIAKNEQVVIPVKFAPTEIADYNTTFTINCGEAGNTEVTLKAVAVNEVELTICDGEINNEYFPIYGYYMDNVGTRSQMLYPAEKLADVVGYKITGIKFYPTAAMGFTSGATELSLKVTDETEYVTESAIAVPSNLVTDLTIVATTELAGGAEVLEYVFTEPFLYEGGNLAVQTLCTVKGNWSRTYFHGEEQSVATATCYWGGTGNNFTTNFLPKMTIVYSKATEQDVVYGDVNGDGFVTSADITALYTYLLSGDDSDIVNGDQNNDGDITSADVTTVYGILLNAK